VVNSTNEHWSKYWKQGFLTSLPTDFKGNYDKEIKDFWFTQFETLPQEACILDVCTGNGAIALLAAEYSKHNRKTFQIIATDAAKIDVNMIKAQFPELSELIDSITFIDELALESFDTTQYSFDLICSQYGIEYCDLVQVARVFSLILKPTGRLAFMSHAKDTQILDFTTNDYKLLESMYFFTRTKKLVRHNASQKELQGYFKQVAYELNRSLLTRVSPVLKLLMRACQFVLKSNPQEFEEGKANLFDFIKSLHSGRARTQDLADVHQKMTDDPNWFKQFAIDGIELLEQSSISYKNSPAGDVYIFKKP